MFFGEYILAAVMIKELPHVSKVSKLSSLSHITIHVGVQFFVMLLIDARNFTIEQNLP